MSLIYPGAAPEFRILKQNGEQTLQVRYINIAQGYTGKWQNVPVVEVKEKETA
jgi:hypothetical protein